MRTVSKVKPVKSRFFLRNVAGMFQDLQRSCGLSVGEVLAIKRTVGATLFECDARVAAYSSSPLVVSDSDIEEYFGGTGVLMRCERRGRSSTDPLRTLTGVVIPDLESDSLGQMLDSIFETDQTPVTRQKVDDALALSGYYICALQRQYSKIATGSFAFLLSRRSTSTNRPRDPLQPAPARWTTTPFSLVSGPGSTPLTAPYKPSTAVSTPSSSPVSNFQGATTMSSMINSSRSGWTRG